MTGAVPAMPRSAASNTCLKNCRARLGCILRDLILFGAIDSIRFELRCGCIVVSKLQSLIKKNDTNFLFDHPCATALSLTVVSKNHYRDIPPAAWTVFETANECSGDGPAQGWNRIGHRPGVWKPFQVYSTHPRLGQRAVANVRYGEKKRAAGFGRINPAKLTVS